MILRTWDGSTRADDANAYADYVQETGFRGLMATPGNRGAFVLRRREGEKAHFRVLSLWDSMEAIGRFAGPEPQRARYYPEDERYLETLAPEVEHYEVLASGGVRAEDEGAVLAREVETLVEGNNWHGPTLRELLDDLPAEAAAARPLARAHTIAELVLHVTAWADVFRRRLEGTAMEEPEQGDYPTPPPPSAAAWGKAREALFTAHRRLADTVADLSDQDLEAPVPGRPFDARYQVRAAIRHTVYHSGQIGLLRKAAVAS
jgi:uncharacterized damage-inducible protein DinB